MVLTKYYDIHGIISLELDIEKSLFNSHKIDEPFSYFETTCVKSPDITLVMNGISEIRDRDFHLFREYYISKNYISFRKNFGRSKYQVEIIGVEEKNIKVNFKWIHKSMKENLLPNYFPQLFIIEPLIELKLLQKGFLLLHSAGISTITGSILLCGRSGAFKTPILIELIKRGNNQYVGDDKVMIDDSTVLSFPKNLSLFNYLFMKESNISEYSNIFDKFKCLLFQNDENAYKFKINDSDKLKSLVFLIKGKNLSDKLNFIEINKEKAFNMLLFNSLSEFCVSNILWEPLVAYSYMNENFNYPLIMPLSDILHKLVQQCDSFYLTIIPDHFSQDELSKLSNRIANLF